MDNIDILAINQYGLIQLARCKALWVKTQIFDCGKTKNKSIATPPMKTSRTLFSHCLAYGSDLSPSVLRKNLLHSQKLGYTGMVIVPALIPNTVTPNEIARVFKAVGMQGLVCGFNPGGDFNPDPLASNPAEVEGCYQELRRQAGFAAEFRDNECGPSLMIGPMHTKHRQARYLTDDDPRNEARLLQGFSDSLNFWIEKASEGLSLEFDIDLAFEPLNNIEDSTPDPFRRLAKAAMDFEHAFLHVDSGHAHSRGVSNLFLADSAHLIRYFEFANKGRNPLWQSRGIDFMSMIVMMQGFNEGTLVGVEPFDPAVIKAFGLEGLCDTTTPGPACLEMDIRWCKDTYVFVQ